MSMIFKTLYIVVLSFAMVSCNRKIENVHSLNNQNKLSHAQTEALTASSKKTLFTVVDSAPQTEPSMVNKVTQPEAEVITAASLKTVSIVGLARANDVDQIAKMIRVVEESKVLRHAATKEKVLKLLGNIEPDKLKLGRIHFDPVRSLVFVSIEAPVRLDLEYFLDVTSDNQFKLQSIHP